MPHKAFNNKNKQFQPKRLWRLLANVFCKRMKYYIYSSQSKRSIPKMNKFSSSAPGWFFCNCFVRDKIEATKHLENKITSQKKHQKIRD